MVSSIVTARQITSQALQMILLHTHIIWLCDDVNYYVHNEFSILYLFYELLIFVKHLKGTVIFCLRKIVI